MSFEAHKNTVLQVSVEMHNPDIVTCARDNTVKVWSLSQTKNKDLASRIPKTEMALTLK
jgi:WD40 repeat protein